MVGSENAYFKQRRPHNINCKHVSAVFFDFKRQNMKRKLAFVLWLTGALVLGFIHFFCMAILALDFYINGTLLLCSTPIVLAILLTLYLSKRRAETPRPSLMTSSPAILSLTALFAVGWFCGNLFVTWTYPPNFS